MPNTDWSTKGYTIARGVFSPAEAGALADEADRLLGLTALATTDNLRCRWANHVDTGECRLDAWDPVIDLSPRFAAAARDPRLLALVGGLYGEPACLFKDKLIYKLPGAPGYDLHQDWIAWSDFPESFVTAAVALDASDAESGGTEFFPGLHRDGSLVPADGRFNRIDPAVVANVPGEIPQLAPGDVVVFGGFVPHRSGPNRSSHPRRLLYASYNRASEGGDQRDRHYVQFRAWLKQQYANHGRFGVTFR
jgi:hypothetical protein